MVVIILNGPPGSGKDTFADYISRGDNPAFRHLKLRTCLDMITSSIYKIDEATWKRWLSTRESKSVPRFELCGMSSREALIHVSENVLKPVFGQDVFAKYMMRGIDVAKNYVVSDGGNSLNELVPILDTFGSAQVVIVRIHRIGCAFEDDSRGYFRTPDIDALGNIKVIDLHNNGTIKEFCSYIDYIYAYEITSRAGDSSEPIPVD
jgi:hypothetical protein